MKCPVAEKFSSQYYIFNYQFLVSSIEFRKCYRSLISIALFQQLNSQKLVSVVEVTNINESLDEAGFS